MYVKDVLNINNKIKAAKLRNMKFKEALTIILFSLFVFPDNIKSSSPNLRIDASI